MKAATEIDESSPLHAGAGASIVVALGELIVLATLEQSQGASWTIGAVSTPFAAWSVMVMALKPGWQGILGSLAITLLYAVLGCVSAANFIFLGFAFPPLMLAVMAGWAKLARPRALALRALGIASTAILAAAFMVYVPLPGALVLVMAPWLSSRDPGAALVINRSVSIVLALALSVVGVFTLPSSVGGTAGLFAMLGGIAILRPKKDNLEDQSPKDPHLFTPSIFGWPDRLRPWLDGQPWDKRL